MTMAVVAAGAVFSPLGPQTEPKMAAHDIVCVHTMVGTFNGTKNMFLDSGYGGTESHFGIRGDGYAEQWQDLDYQADANYNSNYRVISIETQDIGSYPDGNFPAWSGSDVPAWTPMQVAKIVSLLDWLCRRYDIPRELVPDTCADRRGLGYHRQGVPPADGVNWLTGPGAPWLKPGCEQWSGAKGKVCPGNRRIAQFVNDVIPRVQALGDFLMPVTEQQWSNVEDRLVRIEKMLGNGGFVGTGQNVNADETLNAVLDGRFTITGSKTRTAIAGSPDGATTGLVDLGLDRSKTFEDVQLKVDSLTTKVDEILRLLAAAP